VNKLYVIDGPDKSKSFSLTDCITTVGRSSDNDIRLSDKGVSRHHARLLKKNDRIFIVDLKSLQGVFVDAEKIKPGVEVEIKKESNLVIGKTILSFQKESSEKKLAQPFHTDIERKPFDTRESLFTKDSSRKSIRRLELLLNVANIFAQSLNIDKLLGEVIDQIFNLSRRIDRGVILLADKETGTLQEVVSKTRMDDREDLLSSEVNYSKTIVDRVIKDGEPVMMSDTSRVEKADLSDSMEQMDVRSVICVPLKYRGYVRGVIYVDSIGLPGGFLKDDLELLTGLSNTAAIAIENAWLFKAVKQELAERKRAEKAFRDSQEQLYQAQKMKALGTLVAGVAHEINNPINLIMLNIPLLQKVWHDFLPILKQYAAQEPNRKYGGLTYDFLEENLSRLLLDMDMAANRVARIVTDLKNFARQSDVADKKAMAINTAVENAVLLAQTTIRKSGVHLELDLAHDSPLIEGNLQSIEHVILNLVINAIQAIDHDQGKIKIGTGFQSKDGRIYVSVEDNGRGIAPSISGRIFDPFVTDKQAQGGTGLGLSITYSLVKAHGGEITFQSQKGKGASFTVFFPPFERESSQNPGCGR